jgi:arylsulfatase A-like enzyme
LYLAHYAPHAPIQAPEERIQKCLERYKPGFVQLQQARFERQKKLGVAPKNAVLRNQAGFMEETRCPAEKYLDEDHGDLCSHDRNYG